MRGSRNTGALWSCFNCLQMAHSKVMTCQKCDNEWMTHKKATLATALPCRCDKYLLECCTVVKEWVLKMKAFMCKTKTKTVKVKQKGFFFHIVLSSLHFLLFRSLERLGEIERNEKRTRILFHVTDDWVWHTFHIIYNND